jgi:ribosome-associated protein
MKDLAVKNGVVIPEHELEITASRSGGPGGQHVNKTSTRITVRWNVRKTSALSDEQKERVAHNLQSQLTNDGDLIVSSSFSRSQLQNKEHALAQLAALVRKGLHVPKRRMKTRMPKSAHEKRLAKKSQRSEIKKMRSKQW